MPGNEACVDLFRPVENPQAFRADGTGTPRLVPDPPAKAPPVLVLAQDLNQRRLSWGLGADASGGDVWASMKARTGSACPDREGRADCAGHKIGVVAGRRIG